MREHLSLGADTPQPNDVLYYQKLIMDVKKCFQTCHGPMNLTFHVNNRRRKNAMILEKMPSLNIKDAM